MTGRDPRTGALEAGAVRLAFSVPTRSAAEEQLLYGTYKQCGYEGLQLKSGQYLEYLAGPGEAEELARQDPGRFSGLIFGGGLDDEGQQTLREVVRFAARVSSERVIFCHGHPREGLSKGDVRHFADILSRIGREALGLGVKLSLHHHYGQPVMHPRDIEVFFEAAMPGTVGLTLDTAHMWKAGHDDVGSVLERFADVIDNVHLKDCRDDAAGQRLPDGARVAASFMPLGRGEVDFGPVFGALSSTGYPGWVCVDEESGAGVTESLWGSREFVLEHLGRQPGRTGAAQPTRASTKYR
ncbi:MAG: sugar phosphate isomerase/epimerase family protein [Acidimicrobiales bacterium]